MGELPETHSLDEFPSVRRSGSVQAEAVMEQRQMLLLVAVQVLAVDQQMMGPVLLDQRTRVGLVYGGVGAPESFVEALAPLCAPK